jgi:hypothetical protein
MSNVLAIFFSPGKVFTDLKGMEKPAWQLPFIIVLVVIALSAAFTVSVTQGSEEVMIQQEEALRERGLTDEQIEQAKQFTQGPLPVVLGGIGGAVVTAAMLLVFALLLNLFIPALGGTKGYAMVFAVVSYSALVLVPSAILKLILVMVTQSPYVATSLALLAPGIEKTSFLWRFLNSFDFFVIWEMILVAMGITITRDVKKTSAYLLVFVIWFISIFIGIGLQSLGGGPQ